MDLVVLKGDCNVGKTETINVVYQLLLLNGYKQVANNFRYLYNNDFIDVLDNGIKKVGIVSQGDYVIGENSVKNHLIALEDAGCEKALCACTNGKPKIINVINSYAHIVIINKLKEPNISLQRIANNGSAQQIMPHL